MTGSSKGQIAVDSNLLLLLVIGNWNPRFIASHRRLSNYSVGDFYLVRDFVASFRHIVTTAHVLTEVSNLAGIATGHAKQSIYQELARTIDILDERTINATSASTCLEFSIFGLTDAALSMLCLEVPLLTEDGRLAAHLQRKRLKVWTLESLKSFRSRANHG